MAFLRKIVEQGSEYLMPFAIKSLNKMKRRLLEKNLKAASMTIFSDRGDIIKISSTKNFDIIRITGAGVWGTVFLSQYVETKIVWWGSDDFQTWKVIPQLENYAAPLCVIGDYGFTLFKNDEADLITKPLNKIAQITSKGQKTEHWDDDIPFHYPYAAIELGANAVPIYNVIAGEKHNITLTAARGILPVNDYTDDSNDRFLVGPITEKLSQFYLEKHFYFFASLVSNNIVLAFKMENWVGPADGDIDIQYDPVIKSFNISTQTWSELTGSPDIARTGVLTKRELRTSIFGGAIAPMPDGNYVFFKFQGKLAFLTVSHWWAVAEYGQDLLFRIRVSLYVSSNTGQNWNPVVEYKITTQLWFYQEPNADPGIPFVLKGNYIDVFKIQYAIFHHPTNSALDTGFLVVPSAPFSGQSWPFYDGPFEYEFYRFGDTSPYMEWDIDDVFSVEEQIEIDTDKLYLVVYQNYNNNVTPIVNQVVLHFMSNDNVTGDKVHKFFISEDQGDNFIPLTIPDHIMENDIANIQIAQQANVAYIFDDIDDWRI